MVALASVALIAIAFPLTRSAAGAEDPDSTPVLVVSDGFAAALRSQAETLVSAVTLGSPAPAARDAAISHSLDGFPGGALVPRPLLAAAAGVLVQGVLAGPQGEQGLVMQLQEPVQFTLHEGAFPSLVFSTRPTVGAALAALGAGYGSYDIVSPPPDTPLTAGMHVFVERAIAVSLSVGGSEWATVYTQAETVGELLAEQSIKLAEGDSVRPGASSPIGEGMAISVTIMGERTFVEDTPIPFETIYQEDPSFPEGESWVAQYGVDGYVHREYLVVYENGEEISRELVSEFVVAPTYHIVAVGTAPAPVAVAAAVETPSPTPPFSGTADDVIAAICSLPWPCDQMVGVAMCESGLVPSAYNPAGYYGLFQINFSFEGWDDPLINSQVAYEQKYLPALAAGDGLSAWPNCVSY